MLKVRKMLTEVLLDVTNTEICSIAHNVYEKASKGITVSFLSEHLKDKPLLVIFEVTERVRLKIFSQMLALFYRFDNCILFAKSREFFC